jgi:hypothetical protein
MSTPPTLGPSGNQQPGSWPPPPAGERPYVPDNEDAIQEQLMKAQKYQQFAAFFYPMYVAAMLCGLKANRLGANGRGTKYVVGGVIYLVVVFALLVFLAVMILTHPHHG